MSFITRCPACGTAFRVVSDQLKISEGWVRCGRCQHIFDATLDLQPGWPVQDEPEHQPSNAPSHVPQPLQTADAAVELAEKPATESFSESPVASAAVPAESEVAGTPEPDLPSGLPEPVSGHTPTFVRHAQRRAFWRRPGVRLALALLVVLLSLTLVLQLLVSMRDAVLARLPAAEPVLRQVCAAWGCKVEGIHQIEALSIDSSALLRRTPSRFAFDMVLKNASSLVLVPPALELTLTDAEDRIVIRRVLSSSEWPSPRAQLDPGSEWEVRFEFELADTVALPVVGYRAVLFYP